MRTVNCTCGHDSHEGRPCPSRNHCICRESKPNVKEIRFIPVGHGTLVDMGDCQHKLLGFKPGRAGNREGWLIFAVNAHAKHSAPRRKAG